MKRKAKFADGGEVEMSAAERRRQNIQRLNERRATNRAQAETRAEIERFNERMRQGTVTPEDMRRMGGQSDIERFSERAQRGQLTADDMRRAGGRSTASPDFSVNQQGEARRMSPNREVVPYRENLPAEGGRGGPPAVRRENLPVPRSENLPAVRPPAGSAEALRGLATPGSAARGFGGMLGGAAGAAGAALAAGRRALREAALGDYEEEGRRALAERRASRAPAREPAAEAPVAGTIPDTVVTAQAPRPQAPRPRVARPAQRESMSADDLNEIVLRLHRGEKPETETEKRLADRMGIAYRKGGLVKPKGHGPKEEAMEMKGGRYRGGAKEERAEMKAKGGIIKSKAKSPAKLKGKTLMKKGGMAKGGEAGLASTLRGGVVKKPGTDSFNFQAKKMATGGVVQEGGSKYGFTTAKTKMLRRGGMAKGCK